MEEKRLQILQRILVLMFWFLGIVVVGCIAIYIYLSNRGPKTVEKEEVEVQEGMADATTFLPDNCNLYAEMPDITFKDESGKEVKLSDFKGKTLVVTFWASWCPDCHEQFEKIEAYKKLVDEQGNAEYILLDKLDHDKETMEQALQYLKDNHISIPTYFDDGLKAYDMLGMHNVPTTFFIDANGILRAWSGVQITDKSVFEAYLQNCIQGSEVVTQQFTQEYMTDEKGGIHSGYDKKSNTNTLKTDVLSESQGAVLEYAILKEDKELFDTCLSYIENHMLMNGMVSWQVVNGEPSQVNALIDDFRIFESLVRANDLWGGYDEVINFCRKNVKTYGMKETNYIDFYDFEHKEAAKRFTLCYGDFRAMELLAYNDSDYQTAYDHAYEIVTGGIISDEFPLYYSWYNYETSTYETTDLNMSEAMVTLLHLAEIDALPQQTIDWLRKETFGDGVRARYDISGKVVPGYGYESTATYALIAMIGAEIGDDELTGKALKKMEKMRVNDLDLQYNGAFGNKDGTGITSFDQIMPMLAYGYCEKKNNMIK